MRRRNDSCESGGRDSRDGVQIPLARPWRIRDVQEWLSEEIGKPIFVAPWASAGEAAAVTRAFGCGGGLTAVGTDAVVVKYNAFRSVPHQIRQITHEFGHLIEGHHETCRSAPRRQIEETAALSGLEIGVLEFVLTRDIFTSADELAAERVGMMLSRGSTGDLSGRWSIVGATIGR